MTISSGNPTRSHSGGGALNLTSVHSRPHARTTNFTHTVCSGSRNGMGREGGVGTKYPPSNVACIMCPTGTKNGGSQGSLGGYHSSAVLQEPVNCRRTPVV